MSLTAQQRKEMQEAEQELNAIAKGLGIVWEGPETKGLDTSERKYYKQPGQGSGTGIVRKLSNKQVKYIKWLMSTRNTRNLARLPGSEDIENMSLKGACDLIDRLLSCPELPKDRQPKDEPSPKQLDYIKSLRDQHIVPENFDELFPSDSLSRTIASKVIEYLKAQPYKPRETAPVNGTESVTEGLYRVGEVIYRVKRSRESGRLYACEVIPPRVEGGKPEFIYASGAMREIKPEHRMTLDEVNAYSIEVGFCGICGRTLTRKESIDRGIGPICAAKYGG